MKDFDNEYQKSLSKRENARHNIMYWEGYPRDTRFSKTELLFREMLKSRGSHPLAGQLFHDYILIYSENQRLKKLLTRSGVSRTPDKSQGAIGGKQLKATRKRMGI